MTRQMLHGRDPTRAKRIVVEVFESNRDRLAQFSPLVVWTDPATAEFTFEAVGKTISGTVRITTTTIQLDAKVPLVLRPIAELVIPRIAGEIEKRLGPPP